MQERLVLSSLYDILTRELRVCLLVLGELIHNGAISRSGSQICFRVSNAFARQNGSRARFVLVSDPDPDHLGSTSGKKYLSEKRAKKVQAKRMK